MIFAWLGIAFFSTSWVFGISYYHQSNFLPWFILVICGIPFLNKIKCILPGKTEAILALFMLIPAIFVIPWPFKMISLLLFLGLMFYVLPIPRLWPQKISNMLVVSGVLLLFQALGIFLYKSLTAYSHEMPFPFPDLLALISKFLNIHTTLIPDNLALFTMREVHILGTTWDFFLDLSTFCFISGGMALFFIIWISNHSGQKWFKTLTRFLVSFVLSICIWLPLRAGIHLAVLLHRSLFVEYESPLVLMNQIWSGWFNLILLGGAVLIAAKCVRFPEVIPSGKNVETEFTKRKNVIGLLFAFFCVITFTFGLFLDLSGPRKNSHVFVDEYHSDWEPTEKPFDTTWYGEESVYNYAAIYDYCSHFFAMNRLQKKIDKKTLTGCDVLIIKVPTVRYEPDEIEIIKGFVKRGGGLLLIGEHTDVFYTSSYLNDIAFHFGFQFRNDCLLGIDKPFEQRYVIPWIPHPIIQHLPILDFAVSCSIKPDFLTGRGVISAAGLRSLNADYHASNFYPQVKDYTDARYGAFIQLWAKQYGKGRVAAFSDSTIFSNFSAFEPGKSELMLGMIEWLNHKNLLMKPNGLLLFLGLLLYAGMILFTRYNKTVFIIIICTGLLGWVASGMVIKKIHSLNMPFPQRTRPFVSVNIDRSVCDAPLSKGGFIKGTNRGFGIFEHWILRLGYFTQRINDPNDITGELLIFFHPNKYIKENFKDKIIEYVKKGGKILIVDSPVNDQSSANSLLYPFGIQIKKENIIQGFLKASDEWSFPDVSSVEISNAFVLKGGNPIFFINDKPVGANRKCGKGSVTVIGFGARFTDKNMGITSDVKPDEKLNQIYLLEFSIMRSIIENTASQPSN